jgi:hypothetical protein
MREATDTVGLYGTGNAIRTYTGLYVNVDNPEPAMFSIIDIAHALSMQPRYGGHLRRYYSVAQHCIECALEVPIKDSLAALLHDASEAYLCDIPSPIKKLLPDYHRIENKVMSVIADKFGFEYPLNDTVKDVDKYMLEHEWTCLIRNKGGIRYMDHLQAEQIFLNLYRTLCLH